MALLYYFGYVTAYSYFEYFGIDVQLLRLDQQDLLLRSVAALYGPAVALALLMLVAWTLRRTFLRSLEAGRRLRALRLAGVLAVALGLLLLVRGLVGMGVPDIARTEFPAMTPIALGLGALLLGGGIWLARSARAIPSTGTPGTGRPIRLDPAAIALLGSVVVLSLFWTTSTVASAYGRGRAEDVASELDALPSIVLDSGDKLAVLSPAVHETILREAPGQKYRYRYRGLHLLAAASGRLFLIPADWSPDTGATMVLPDDSSVRLQLSP